MHPTSLRILHGGIASAVVGACLLAVNPAPAQALPVYSDAEVEVERSTSYSSGTCTPTHPAIVNPANVDLVENGPAVVTNVSTTATYEKTGDATDTITSTSTLKATSAATTSAGLPGSISTSFDGSITATASKPTAECNIVARASVGADFEFTTATALWATLKIQKKGPAYVDAYIYDNVGDGYEELLGRDFAGGGSTTVLLPPGQYGGYVYGQAALYVDSALPAARTVSGSSSITFAAIGSALAAPAGKARKYVSLPTARNCASHNATAALTGKKKKIKRIDKVTYEVNGKKAATLKGKKVKKNKTVALAIADNKAATITATVLLDSGKKKTVTASYLACSS